MGTWNRGMLVYDPETDIFFAPVVHSYNEKNPEVGHLGIASFYTKSENEIYITASNGLYIYNSETTDWKLVKLNDLKSSQIVEVNRRAFFPPSSATVFCYWSVILHSTHHHRRSSE